jgi:probable F420-dependent oxidoreductase
MQIGVIFPQTEFGHDSLAVRDYAQTAEALGYTHILAYDHVLGANPDRPGGWRGPYTYQNPFLEPFVLFTYMAAHTARIGFIPGVLILPQRETALVAKQAATLDVLSGGRLRLGVGIGWNETEYIALNQDFHVRGRRIEEQITVLRRLWTEPLVTFRARWHDLPDVGLNPLPLQRPIPIWMGGHAEPVLQRAARMADGWLPNYRTPADAAPHLAQLDRYLAEAGRSRADFGIEARMHYRGPDPDGWRAGLERWRSAGATHFTVNTMGAGLQTPADHIAAIEAVAAALLSG